MIASIIVIIFVIIIALIVFFIIKKMLKVVFVLTALIIIALVAGAAIIYYDAKSLQENFESSPNLFLFNETEIIAGFETVPGSEEPKPVPDLSSYNLKLEKGDYYKVFVISKKAFDSVSQLEIDNTTYTKDFVLVLINSQTPVDDYIDNLLIAQGVPQEQREIAKQSMKSGIEFTDAEFRGVLFSSLFAKANEKNGPVFIFREYKNGNIQVYDETAVFKIIDIIPYSFVKSMFVNATSAVKEKIG